MDDDYRGLARRLFTAATAMLEDAIQLSTEGPAPRLTPEQLVDSARGLHAAARDIAAVTEAAMIVASLSINHHRNRRKPPLKELDFPGKASMHC